MCSVVESALQHASVGGLQHSSYPGSLPVSTTTPHFSSYPQVMANPLAGLQPLVNGASLSPAATPNAATAQQPAQGSTQQWPSSSLLSLQAPTASLLATSHFQPLPQQLSSQPQQGPAPEQGEEDSKIRTGDLEMSAMGQIAHSPLLANFSQQGQGNGLGMLPF